MIVAPDSAGYLNMTIIRSPAYPIFLKLIKLVSGRFFSTAVLIVQYLINIAAVYYFIGTLFKTWKTTILYYVLLAAVLLAPCLYAVTIVNCFLSEALAYPLYLITIALLIKALYFKSQRYLYYVLPVLFVLLLTRNQFLFVIVPAIILTFWLGFSLKSIRTYIPLALLFLVLPLITGLTDKTYHKVMHGHFVKTPWTGIHLLTPAMFVADAEDVTLFTDAKEQLFFKTMYQSLANKKLTTAYLQLPDYEDEVIFYCNQYTKIANHTLYDEGKELLGSNLTETEKYIYLDKLTQHMTLPLVKNNFSKWAKLNFKNFCYGFGNARYALIYILLLGLSCFAVIKKKTDYLIQLIALVSLVTLLNVALVAIGIHTIKRFTFYNDWTLLLCIFILWHALTNTKTVWNK